MAKKVVKNEVYEKTTETSDNKDRDKDNTVEEKVKATEKSKPKQELEAEAKPETEVAPTPAPTPPKSYVHIDTFLQTAVPLFNMSRVQAAGFKMRMNGRAYQKDEQVFVDELKAYLNLK